MNMKVYALVAILLLLFIMQSLPGCMMIGFHDDFVFLPSAIETSGEFIPYLYIDENTWHFQLLLFRIEMGRIPHSFVMLQFDPTYLGTDEGFKSFVLDNLYIEFADGNRVDCIDPDLPEDQRSFAISDKSNYEYEKTVFEGVITKRMDFTVQKIGTAIRSSGEKVPFKETTKYKYNGKDATFHTILDKWASC